MIKIIGILTTILSLLHYSGNAQHQTSAVKNGFYQNPIFAGDYADPSIMRDGEDFYMVHSSFEYYPGLLIWHSKDLINWNPVTNALYKNVGSVWAPDITKFNGRYYIYFPANYNIYVVHASSINGPWSEPVSLKVSSIDPGHVVDDNGKRYLFFNNGGFVQLAPDGLSVVGETKHSYGGWKIPREWSIECFCLEGPKLVKHNGYYHITVAEGGTAGPATGHMVVSARSKSLEGPWENSPYNPILRTTSNEEKWWSKGHGTIIDDASGKWWMIYHAYEKGFHNHGRQTCLVPIEWTKDGWYKIAGKPTAIRYKKPALATTISSYTLSDRFGGSQLKPHWKFFGEYDTTRFSVANNSIHIKAKGNSIGNCSPLLCVPSHNAYTVDVEVQLEGKATAGLVLFYNSKVSSGMLAGNGNILANIHGWQFDTEWGVIKNRVFLRLKNINNTVDMFYSLDGVEWKKIENSLETTPMNHNVLGEFLSIRIGLCAIGEGSVTFKNFNYQPINR